MNLNYKETESQSHLEHDSTTFISPKLTTVSQFDYLYTCFLSNNKNDIKFAIISFTSIAKKQNFLLFFENNLIQSINTGMILIFHQNSYDCHSEILRFYKWMTICPLSLLGILLTSDLTQFFYSLYLKNECPSVLCRSLLIRIFSNIFQKSEQLFLEFINRRYFLKLLDEFRDHIELIDSSHESCQLISSFFELFPCFYSYFDIVQSIDRHFFTDCNILYIECFQNDNESIKPALFRSINKLTKRSNRDVLYQFYRTRYFSIYFSALTNYDHKVRFDILSIFLNFSQVTPDDLLLIVDGQDYRLFDIEINFSDIDQNDMNLLLNIMNQYLLKSIEIAKVISFSTLFAQIAEIDDQLEFTLKSLFYEISSQLIRTGHEEIISRVFDVFPHYIEKSIQMLLILDTSRYVDHNRCFLLDSYLIIINLIEKSDNTGFFSALKEQLLDDELISTLQYIIDSQKKDTLLFEKSQLLLEKLQHYLEDE